MNVNETLFVGWTKAEIDAYGYALRLTDAFMAGRRDYPLPDSDKIQRWSEISISRWLKRRTEADAGNPRALLSKRSQAGRPPLVAPSAEDVIKLKSAYLRSNRAREKGSKTLAARMLAKQGKLSPETANAILFKGGDPANGPRTEKTPPDCILDAMRVAPAMMRRYRSPKNAKLAETYCPGTMRMARSDDGEFRRLRPGERQSWDDGSINFCVCVPWPWGGDRCSDKYGVKIGRFQLLAGIDDATDYAPGFTFVMRPLSSYRQQDVGAAMYRVHRDTYAPDSVMLEGGAWQSRSVLRFLDVAGIRWDDAKGRPHSKLIENYWNRLWSVMSLQTDGQIGRYRGEMEQENALWMRAQQGRMDPREAFPDLNRALDVMESGFGYVNAEPVSSRLYGKWVPQEAHDEFLQAHPRRALDPALGWIVAPEQHERTVLRGGMVRVKTMSPFGVSFPYHFAARELSDHEGRMVRVHFDPWDSPIRATITLAHDHGALKAGAVLTHRAECLDNAPQIMEAAGAARAGISEDGIERTLAIRKAIGQAMRTEFRALGLGGRRKTTTEIKGADGSLLRVEGGAGVADGAAVTAATGIATESALATAGAAVTKALSNRDYRERERADLDLAALDAFERAERR